MLLLEVCNWRLWFLADFVAYINTHYCLADLKPAEWNWRFIFKAPVGKARLVDYALRSNKVIGRALTADGVFAFY
jgi:hypothetical protein